MKAGLTARPHEKYRPAAALQAEPETGGAPKMPTVRRRCDFNDPALSRMRQARKKRARLAADAANRALEP